ncbi:hydrolase [Sphaerisporangium krabiense]|uniref:Beta-N-acetylhexosaminidase n=1 Tax=Sphaerisporangium krabiense TaxID=763782 RepID=A0A7W8Z743_9ACTN|nr:glycoside hydrolase family 3 protein [Sphaerisporangium krabiense]MBB5628607.1 beta-N-acetylhexosaminidase [Sphaerisporangium krabiense]GII60557.1 hydrolase [Sphaerisporangium krabiense]
MKRSPELLRLADSVLLPGFEGRTPPDWLRRRLGEGLSGVVLFSRNIGTPSELAELTAALRAERPEAVIGIDEEAGDVTRLEASTGSSRPGNYALGVVDDVALTEKVAYGVGLDLAASGVNVNFAPAADVNSNPRNPVIGLRSFGADPELVARHTAAWVRGLQAAGVAACAKHFPGHGDTAVDSHHGLPSVGASLEQLHKVELLPFRAAIAEGVQMIMTGHLLVDAYDPGLPATLSPRILTGLLRDEMGFQGVTITDAVEMAAIVERYGIGGGSVRAVAAGADLICIGGEHADDEVVVTIREAIADAVAEGALPEERLAEAARRVEALTTWTGSFPGPRPSAARETLTLGAHLDGHAAAAMALDGHGAPAPDLDGHVGLDGHASATALLDGSSSDGYDDGPGHVPPGLDAARRAIRVAGDPGSALPLPAAPHVVELTPLMSMAIDKHMPWGVGEPLGKLLPGTTVTRAGEEEAGSLDEAVLRSAEDRPLVLVVRDAHRHAWQIDALTRLLAARPDAIVVEMGLPGRTDLGAVHIATHGAARVCGQAAAEVLTGLLPVPS